MEYGRAQSRGPLDEDVLRNSAQNTDYVREF